uniref:Cyclin C-terminal domain-containing protein n=1 Tax=Kalanchoe fedtschenkoi TaxID=63787 RepID=A0A7N0UVL9_KALFE
MEEKTILGHLEWALTVATPYVFVIRFIKVSLANKKMEQMAHFPSEPGMMRYGVAVMFCPSLVAASTVYAARCTLKKTPAWDATLQLYIGFSEARLLDYAKLLIGLLQQPITSVLKPRESRCCAAIHKDCVEHLLKLSGGEMDDHCLDVIKFFFLIH